MRPSTIVGRSTSRNLAARRHADADGSVDQRRRRRLGRSLNRAAATASAPRSSRAGAIFPRGGVRAEGGGRVGMATGPGQVSLTGRREERVGQPSIGALLVVGAPAGALDPAAGAAGELSGRDRSDRRCGDVIQTVVEEVVEHEGHALGGRQCPGRPCNPDVGGRCVLLRNHRRDVTLGPSTPRRRSGSSRRLRARSPRQIRATTVVSQRLSTLRESE